MLAVIAAVLPWATLTTGFGSVSRNGMDDGGDGVFTAALGVIGLLAALQAGRALIVTLIAGVLVAGIGVIDIMDVSDLGEGVSVGAGLYLTVFAGVIMFAAAAVCLQKPKD